MVRVNAGLYSGNMSHGEFYSTHLNANRPKRLAKIPNSHPVLDEFKEKEIVATRGEEVRRKKLEDLIIDLTWINQVLALGFKVSFPEIW